jgi:hypothetical protein
MYIKLKWLNRNQIPVTTKIYRNDTQKANDQLGTPLATLDGSITDWTDNTVVRRNTYYYTLETVNGGQSVYSAPIKVVADYNNGPGPRDLQWGDSQFGFFGTINSTDFITPADLNAMLVIPPQANTSNPLPTWNKWIRRGKICYVPNAPVHIAALYDTFYKSGVHFGTADNGPWMPGSTSTPVTQGRTISKGFDKFIVRLPTGADDRNNPTDSIAATPADSLRRYSEVADFLYPMLSNLVCPSARCPKLPHAVGYGNLNAGRDVVTSTRQGTTGFVRSIGTTAPTLDGALYEKFGAVLAWNVTGSWIPVLEMVPDKGIEVVV